MCSLPRMNVISLKRSLPLFKVTDVRVLTSATRPCSRSSGVFLSFEKSMRNPTFILRNYSAKLPELSSAPENAFIKDVTKPEESDFCEHDLEVIQNTLNNDSSPTDEGGVSLKKVSPSLIKERNKNEQLRVFVKKISKETDLTELLNIFALKLGVKEITVTTYTYLIHIFSLGGEHRRAQKVFDLLLANGLIPNERTYCALMNAYSNGGELTDAIRIFELILKNSTSESSYPYSIIIKAYMKHNQVQNALDVIGLMKQKLSPDVKVYNTLIQACTESKHNDRVWAAYEMMLKDGLLPDELTYNLLISICQKKDIKQALRLIEELQTQNIPPNQKMLSILLSALCSETEDYHKAIKLMNNFFAQEKFNSEIAAHAVRIQGTSLRKNLASARRFFYRLHQIKCDSKIQLASFSTLFEAYSSALAQDMILRQIDIMPTEKTSGFTFLNKPPPKCANDCTREAILLLPFLEKIDTSKDSLNDISHPWVSFVSVLAKHNYFNDAMQWFETISKQFKPIKSYFYTYMLAMCTRLRKKEAFSAILKRANIFLAPLGPGSSLTESEKRDYKRVNYISSVALASLYLEIIMGLAKFGCLTEALDYFEMMTKDLSINWKGNGKGYRPLFVAIRQSKSVKLKSRLEALL